MPEGLPVFHVDELPGGARTTLDGPEGKHAATVRRLRAGEHLLLTDGRGGMARCAVTEVGKDELALEVIGSWHVPRPRLRVRLAQALVKGDRSQLPVEVATEAGADAVVPWRAARCVAKWDDGPRGAKALAKWRETVRESAKQARRAWTPEVAEPVSTRELTRLVGGADAALVLHETGSTALRSVELPGSGEVLLIVGPEGGIAPEEVEQLTAAGARSVRLGPSVLRASTAPAVALGALGALTERWC
ncbi:16S rRNA (uracil(1498)-N(3))-methyltransferase [Salinifilum aidingensis]